ncbi:MAG: hypothetical protein J1G04_00555 [Clostridiales bacterium]|nr:hypothetical protein [Clostridiales bacterium]
MEVLYRLIPDEYADGLRRLSIGRVSELRIRNRMPVRVCYDGVYHYLGRSGIVGTVGQAIVAGSNEAEQVIMRACGRSLYTVTDTIKRGYVSVAGGIRIGVCGTGVADGGRISAVKEFSSVDIRVPHEIKGCAETLYGKLSVGGLKNTLIVSPPSGGKTTVIRDLCRIISDRGYNVLLCDEKHEIAAVSCGVPTLDVGRCTDVICGLDKNHVIKAGILNLRPDVIITDELFGDDTEIVTYVAYCGVTIISTAHATDIDELVSKPDYEQLLNKRVFSRFAVISPPPLRTIAVYDDSILVSGRNAV